MVKIADILREFEDNRPSDEFLAALHMYVFNRVYKMSDENKQMIDAGFRQEMKPLGEQLTVWRGLMLDSWDDFKQAATRFDPLKVGWTIGFDNYTSTSTEKHWGIEHSQIINAPVNGVSILFEMELLPTTPVLRLDDYGEYIEEWKYACEDVDTEIILPPGVEFEIVDRHEWEPEEWETNVPEAEHWEAKLRQVK